MNSLNPPPLRRRLTWTVLAGTFASLMLAGSPAFAALEAQPSRAKLGKVKAGQSAVARFKLRNTGSQPLKIRTVDGDCGCLTPEFPRVIPANGTGELKVRFEPFAIWSGVMVKHVTVRPEDRSQPDLKLDLVADVVPFVKIEPRRTLTVPIRPGEVVKRELSLVPRAGSTLRITKAESQSPLVKAVLVPPAAGDRTRTHKLKLTIGPNRTPGDFSAAVTVRTTEPRIAELPVQIRGQASAGPVVIPGQLMLATVRPDQASQTLARLRVFSREGPLRVLSVDPGTPALRTEIQARQAGRFYSVLVRPAGRLRSGVLQAKIRIKTDHPKFPVVTVPFHATVQ